MWVIGCADTVCSRLPKIQFDLLRDVVAQRYGVGCSIRNNTSIIAHNVPDASSVHTVPFYYQLSGTT
jgi:hypothetical protein